MMEAWAIDRPEAREAWQDAQERASWSDTFDELRAAGKVFATDMGDHVGPSPKECPIILLRFPEGRALGLGMGAALKGFNFDYYRTPAKRGHYTSDDIRLLRPDIDLGEAVWVASAVNGERAHAGAAVDLLMRRAELETVAFSHLVVNTWGNDPSTPEWTNGELQAI